MEQVNFYTFSYKNVERAARMTSQFSEENLNLEFVKPVEISDERISLAPENHRRTWAIMFNHLDMLTQFLATDAAYGVFCEDDILIRKGIQSLLPEITAVYKRLNLEILLLGYLMPYKPLTVQYHNGTEPVSVSYNYISYGDDIWGSQMYMFDRRTAEKFLKLYSLDYAVRSLSDTNLAPFSPDWILTKLGRRAAIYPMLAIEEGSVVTSHDGQRSFHSKCHTVHYDANVYN